MAVYHINKGIGRASSGIEYAQKYRFDLVKDFPEQQYFVYCDHIGQNIIRYTDNIGIDMDFILSAYSFMAGQKNHRSTFTVADFAATLSPIFEKTEENERFVSFKQGTTHYKLWLIEDLGTLDRVDFIVNNRLMEVSYYSDRLTHVDYYSEGKVSSRYFYDEAGQLSMRQFYQSGKIALTLLDDKVLQGRAAFYDEFFRRLNFNKDDLIILDRNQDLGDALFPRKADAKLVVVVHAEHFSLSNQAEDWVLWNNYYEYPFTNAKHVDAFIVSTHKQEELLREQFELVGQKNVRILTIPVGSIPEIATGEQVEANKYKFLTASRLAPEKHIDVLIKAVAQAKKEVPELEFHIYGAGKLSKDLKELIDKLDAKGYIVMEGHKQLADEYGKYGGYLTASGSEGFGLTILEAIGACLPIIGLRVNYGNTEFVETGVNGILVEKTDEEEQVQKLAQAIAQMTAELDYPAAVAFAKEKVASYTAPAVQEKWRELYYQLLGGKA